MKRIVVVGNSGAGKSTLASELAVHLRLPYIASDGFYWEDGWTPAASAVVRRRIVESVAGDRWVIDGNCIAERDVVWGKADALIWLDYTLPLVLWRVCERNFRWVATQERTWSGNRMTLGRACSGIRHSLRTYTQKRSTYPRYLAEFPHLSVIHFRAPQEAKLWLAYYVTGNNKWPPPHGGFV